MNNKGQIIEQVRTLGDLKRVIVEVENKIGTDAAEHMLLATEMHSEFTNDDIQAGVIALWDNRGYLSRVYHDTDKAKVHGYFVVAAGV